MEEFINTLTSNPIYLVIAVIIGALLLFAIVKKVLKMVVILLILTAGYVGYLAYTGEDIPMNADELMEHVAKKTEKIREKGEELLKEGKEKVQEELNERVDEQIKEKLEGK